MSLCVIGDVHLLHQTCFVGADRLDRKIELPGYLGQRLPCHQHPEHLVFAIREHGVRGGIVRAMRFVRELFRHFRADERAAGGQLAKRRNQFR